MAKRKQKQRFAAKRRRNAQILAEKEPIEILSLSSSEEEVQAPTNNEVVQIQSTLQTSRELSLGELFEKLERNKVVRKKRFKDYRNRTTAESVDSSDVLKKQREILKRKRAPKRVSKLVEYRRALSAKNSKAYRDRKRAKAEEANYENYIKLSQNQNTSPVPYFNIFRHFEAHAQFKELFLDNNFGIACSVCDRLWYDQNLKPVPSESCTILLTEFPNIDLKNMLVCLTCCTSLKKGRIPLYSTTNGFKYPTRPDYLPVLDLVSERLISPRLPCTQIRRLRHDQSQCEIFGQVINVPVSVNNMVTCLPRVMDDDYCINVHINHKNIYKSSNLMGFVNKHAIRQWLDFLIDTPLYKHHSIRIDNSLLKENSNLPSQPIDNFSEEIGLNENLQAQQQTLLWNAVNFLKLTPAEDDFPTSLLFNEYCEEFAFPSIYLGQYRVFKEGLTVTPFMIASSELRRADRRGVTPQHLFYMVMKIVRIRTRDALPTARKYIGKKTNLTRAQLKSSDFVDRFLETNLTFLRSLPNSAYYWSQRKRDLFAMIHQFGKPTFFLTMSANEMGWPKLMKLLYNLRNHGVEISSEELANMHCNHKATLINDDPVTCAIYFNKLIHVILDILQSKKISPFGKHIVKHYFKRIEFHECGSPRAHILLWLNESPINALMEDKLAAEELIDKLVAVSPVNASGFEKLQQHKHTFNCFKKKNSTLCRFEAPFMPCSSTTILQPMSITDPRRQFYLKQYKLIWKALETNDYPDLDHFLRDNKIDSYAMYIDILRAGITRPQVFLKRETTEKWIVPFNSFILNVLGSSMDFQFIIDEYSCAKYVVEYVNKTDRSISNLQRQLIDTMEKHPEFEFNEITKQLSFDLLNNVELSSQEAAWFLLRQDVSKSSVKIVYIPTVWPAEREIIRKSDNEEENIDSGDFWLDNCFAKYEKRPQELNDLTLAQAVAFYGVSKSNKWTRRRKTRVIRYRNYDIADDPNEYQREMVTLHWPFRDEEKDILAHKKYIQIYDNNDLLIMQRMQVFVSNFDIEKTMQICRELCNENNEDEDIKPDLNILAATVTDANYDFVTNTSTKILVKEEI